MGQVGNGILHCEAKGLLIVWREGGAWGGFDIGVLLIYKFSSDILYRINSPASPNNILRILFISSSRPLNLFTSFPLSPAYLQLAFTSLSTSHPSSPTPFLPSFFLALNDDSTPSSTTITTEDLPYNPQDRLSRPVSALTKADRLLL